MTATSDGSGGGGARSAGSASGAGELSRAATGRDIVVVGGGPAGLTTALSIARRSPSLLRRLVLLEAQSYPREKYCAGAVGGRGERILSELDASPEVPSAPIEGMSLRVHDGQVSQRVVGIGRVVRRIEFDAALAKLAKDAGVAIVENTKVASVTPKPGGGVRVETNHGAIDAAIVVGADGVGSVVRKAVGLGKGELRAQALEIDTEPVESDGPRDIIHFDASDRRYPGYTWDFPTVVGGRALVCRGIYHMRMADEVVDIAKIFDERLAAMGLDLSKYKNKRYAERGLPLSGALGDGAIMLVGEAAGIDPITGEGIAQAIEYGDMAARFIIEHYERGRPVSAWTEWMRTSRLGHDLGVRTRALAAFYGPQRPRVERFLLENKHALFLGCQHFGGVPIDRGRLARLVMRGSVALAGAQMASWVGRDAS